MLELEKIRWWYSGGWLELIRHLGESIRGTADFFSMGLMLKTLFMPFRQIAAGASGSPGLGGMLRDWSDRAVSRVIGFLARTSILIVGAMMILIKLVFSLIMILLWPLVLPGIVTLAVLALIWWMPW